ncbi:hypothetical protein J4441_04710 [Candidatus Micrarchaeota archaeon]|nr:hypothetical protein [Candidatus Micrarchaeota archaeon]
MENRAITIGCIGAGALSLLYAALSSSPYAAIISSFFFFASLLIWKYGYILIPPICSLFGIRAQAHGFELSLQQDAIISQEGSDFVASAYLELQMPHSLSDKPPEEAAAYCKSFEAALCSLKAPCQFSLLLSNLDLSGELESIKARRSMAESKLASLLSSKDPLNSAQSALLKREIAMWNRLFSKLTSGSMPMEVLFYALTSARGASRQEALTRLSSQALEISAALSSSLNVGARRLSAEQLALCIPLSRRIPPTKDAMRDSLW